MLPIPSRNEGWAELRGEYRKKLKADSSDKEKDDVQRAYNSAENTRMTDALRHIAEIKTLNMLLFIANPDDIFRQLKEISGTFSIGELALSYGVVGIFCSKTSGKGSYIERGDYSWTSKPLSVTVFIGNKQFTHLTTFINGDRHSRYNAEGFVAGMFLVKYMEEL